MRNVNTETTTGRVKKTALSLLLATGCIYGGNTLAQSVTEVSSNAQSNASVEANASVKRAQVVNALEKSASSAAQTSADLAVSSGTTIYTNVQGSAESTQETVSRNSASLDSQSNADVLLNAVAISDDGETSEIGVDAAVNAVNATTVQIDSMNEDAQSSASASGEQIVDISAQVSADTQAWVNANSQTTAETVDSVSNSVIVDSNLDASTEVAADISQQSSAQVNEMTDQGAAFSANLNSVTEAAGSLASEL